MKLLDRFRKRPGREIRASTGGYEAQRLRAAEFEAEVPHRLPSIAEALVSYFTRGAQAIKVETTYPMAVNRAMLAASMRGLLLRGDSVWAIETGTGQPVLRPASSWSVTGQTSDPATWRYSVTDVGETIQLQAASLLHFRINVDMNQAQPWRGQSPLTLARRSLNLLAEADAQLSDQFANGAMVGMAVESVSPIGIEESDRMSKDIAKAFSRRAGGQRRGGVLVLSGAKLNPVKGATAGDSDLRQLRESLMAEVCANFGVPPSLIIQSRDTGGAAGRREIWREFLTAGLMPVVKVLEAELRLKLDSSLRLTIPELLASDIASRARALRSLVEAEVPMAEAKELTGLLT